LLSILLQVLLQVLQVLVILRDKRDLRVLRRGREQVVIIVHEHVRGEILKSFEVVERVESELVVLVLVLLLVVLEMMGNEVMWLVRG
jgi:hypothetical protein